MTDAMFLKLLMAICFVESDHRETIINVQDGTSASYGYCQVKYSTAKLMGYKGNITGLLDKQVNLKYAMKYLKWQYKRYGSIYKAVAAYNAGSVNGNIRNWKYVNKVMNVYARN